MSEITREEFDELRKQVQKNTERLAAGDTALAVMGEQLRQIIEKLDKMEAGMSALQEKPGKRWEAITSAVLQWVVTALLAYIAVKMGIR